jgi:hypothetical protein
MPGFIQMIEGLEGLDSLDDFADLGATEGPPQLVTDILREIANDPKLQLFLRMSGRAVANELINDTFSDQPSPPNVWIKGLIAPFIGPFVEGIKDVASAKIRPIATGLTVAIGGLLLAGGIYLARRKKD